jgi:ABC-type bacteriocin/lantibiotic exporter with double-glycine peptidase domain
MSPLRRLIGLIRPEGTDIRVVVAFAVGVGVLSLATPLAVEALVSTVAMNLLMQQLVILSLVLFVCLALAAAMRALQTLVVEAIQQRLFVRVTSDLAYRLPRVRADAFDREYGPELVNRFFDVLTVQKVGALLLLDGIAIVPPDGHRPASSSPSITRICSASPS